MAKLLRYVGNGEAYLGVPARDITDEDVAALPPEWTLEALAESPYYQKIASTERLAHAEEVRPHEAPKAPRKG